MARKRHKPEVAVNMEIGDHTLYAERWSGVFCIIRCPSWPELAKEYEGKASIVELQDEFTRRATALQQQAEPEPARQLTLFDDAEPEPPAQVHSATSCEAADAIAPVAGKLRQIVFTFIAGRGEYGATDEETQGILGMPASTQRPRRIELVEAGRVKDSGKTRKTKSGRNAVVWTVTTNATEAA